MNKISASARERTVLLRATPKEENRRFQLALKTIDFPGARKLFGGALVPAKRSFACPAGVTRTPPAQGSTLLLNELSWCRQANKTPEGCGWSAEQFLRAALKERNHFDKRQFVKIRFRWRAGETAEVKAVQFAC
ncbi:hypothetical protein [uncultured Rikenella sp.]|uniref:hypothetical protein n=1 Tax=uncultured Rikenella sp. TaxID=368003 RepID=UPI0026098CEE|nr:hypothetical protein [uncultured Rikenella sp.]